MLSVFQIAQCSLTLDRQRYVSCSDSISTGTVISSIKRRKSCTPSPVIEEKTVTFKALTDENDTYRVNYDDGYMVKSVEVLK